MNNKQLIFFINRATVAFFLVLNFFVSAMLFTSPIFAAPQPITVVAEDISNRDYFPAVLAQLNTAHDSIDVAMYSMYLSSEEPAHPANRLAQALIDAHQRGVAVTVYLDHSKSNSKGNLAAYKMLSDAGVEVYFLSSQYKLHAKTILIDGQTIIDGSANWTRNAVEENIESNYILRDALLAAGKEDFFRCMEQYVEPTADSVPSVKISRRFLEDNRFAPSMVREDAHYALRFYLKLLRDNTTEYTPVTYTAAAAYLGIKIDKYSNYRKEVRRVVDDLKNKYCLIDYQLNVKNNLKVRLADYGNTQCAYVPVREEYFVLPLTFWQYGLDKQLNTLEQFCYFIALNEQQRRQPRHYWWLGFQAMTEKYHISEKILVKGFGGLEHSNLIEVRRSRVEKGKAFDDRTANEYSLKPLLSPAQIAQRWRAIEKSCGKEKFERARSIAAHWEKDNDFDFVKGIITLIDSYGLPAVEGAMAKVADYSPNNSARNLDYLEKVIKSA